MSALISFVCDAAQHRSSSHALPATDSPLTIHDHQWAYCPAGVLSEHEWTPIAPAGLEYVKLRHAGWVVAEHPTRPGPHRGG